jgi:Catalase-related immune-responsive
MFRRLDQDSNVAGVSGDADRYNHREGNDDYKQPGDLFRLLPPDGRERRMDNVRDAMLGVPVETVRRAGGALLAGRPGLRHQRGHPHGPVRRGYALGASGGVTRQQEPASPGNGRRRFQVFRRGPGCGASDPIDHTQQLP